MWAPQDGLWVVHGDPGGRRLCSVGLDLSTLSPDTAVLGSALLYRQCFARAVDYLPGGHWIRTTGAAGGVCLGLYFR